MMSLFQQSFRQLRYGRPIVVVSGLPRSGTSMMMKMLEAGGVPVWVDGIRAADHQNPKGYYELERVKELDKGGDQSWVREGRGRAVKVISSLLEHLPDSNNYRVLFMHRDLSEVLASQQKMLVDRGEQGGTAGDEALRKYYEMHLRKTKHLLTHAPHFSALTIDYGDALKNAKSLAERVSRFLGGRLDVPAMGAVVDGELYRNRRGER